MDTDCSFPICHSSSIDKCCTKIKSLTSTLIFDCCSQCSMVLIRCDTNIIRNSKSTNRCFSITSAALSRQCISISTDIYDYRRRYGSIASIKSNAIFLTTRSISSNYNFIYWTIFVLQKQLLCLHQKLWSLNRQNKRPAILPVRIVWRKTGC